MIAPVFVDTNILLYARDVRDPIKQTRAAEWLDHLWREQLGRSSTQVLSEYYVNVTRKFKPGLPPEEAWDDVQTLFAWNPQPIDAELLSRARMVERHYQLSWWDSMIVAAAQAQGCAILLTEDLSDSAVYGGVKIRNPFSLSVSEGAAEYSAAAVVSRPIPRRGRPKRRAA